jgi:hypothetical protein
MVRNNYKERVKSNYHKKKVWKKNKIQSFFCPLIVVQKTIRGAKCNVMLVCIVYIVKKIKNLAQKYKQAFILLHKLIITINEGFQTKTQSMTWIIHNQTKQTYKQTFKQHKQAHK